jgi:hypothetical protein
MLDSSELDSGDGGGGEWTRDVRGPESSQISISSGAGGGVVGGRRLAGNISDEGSVAVPNVYSSTPEKVSVIEGRFLKFGLGRFGRKWLFSVLRRGGVPICSLMISSATSVRGESRPEPEERKKRSTGEAGDGEGLKTVEYKSVMKAPRIMQLIGRIRAQQKRRALHRLLTSSSRKTWAVGGSS